MQKILGTEEMSRIREKIALLESERDEAKAALHIMTTHCCSLISKLENRNISEIRSEMEETIKTLINS